MTEPMTDARLAEIEAMVTVATTPTDLAKALGMTFAWSKQGTAIDRLSAQAPSLLSELLREVKRLRSEPRLFHADTLGYAVLVRNAIWGDGTDDQPFGSIDQADEEAALFNDPATVVALVPIKAFEVRS